MQFTILITSYNKEKYIDNCIQSIINIGLNNIKLIIFDDCSTDDSWNKISTYKKKHKEIEIYQNKKNMGVSYTRNAAIKKVKTPYFTFVDADDYLANDFFEVMTKTINDYNNLDVISYQMATKKNNKIIKKYKASFGLTSGYNALYNFIVDAGTFDTPVGYIYSKKYWTKHKFQYLKDTRYMEDFGLTPIIILKCDNIISLDYIGYYIELSEDSLSRTSSIEKERIKANDIIKQGLNLLNHFSNKNIPTKYRQTYKMFAVDTIIRKQKYFSKSIIKEYNKQIKKLKLYKHIEPNNLKYIIKRIIIFINPKLYLKIIK